MSALSSLPAWLRVASALVVLAGSAACFKRDRDPEAPAPARVKAPPRGANDPLELAVFGDWGTGLPGMVAMAETIARRHRAHGFDVVLTLGDNFYPTGVSSTTDDKWVSRFVDLYGPLGVDFRPSLGNHDHYGSVDAQIDYAKVNPRWKMPARFYSFTEALPGGGRALFIALDTEPLVATSDNAEQLAWLDRVLKTNDDVTWRIVYGHHPVHSRGPHGDHEALQQALVPRFRAHGVDLYLAGHDHNAQWLAFDDDATQYVICGGGGGTDAAYPLLGNDDVKYASTGGGFCELALTTDRLTLSFLDAEGETQHRLLRRRRPGSTPTPSPSPATSTR